MQRKKPDIKTATSITGAKRTIEKLTLLMQQHIPEDCNILKIVISCYKEVKLGIPNANDLNEDETNTLYVLRSVHLFHKSGGGIWMFFLFFHILSILTLLSRKLPRHLI